MIGTDRKHPGHVETEWGWMPAPKFATERDHRFTTRGTRQAKFAEVWLREPFMPAQRMIADVAGELDEWGLPRYSLVVSTFQRQGGKSHLALARKGERCFTVPGFRSWYTAQTGGDARDQFLKFGEQIDDKPLGKIVRTLIGNGREVMKFPNGSWIRPHPPTEKALHGKQSDDNDVDEAWAFEESEGKAILQAIGPTQLTRPGAQTFIWSAGGTALSTWLAKLVARGREGDPSIAYFEFGIPDDADALDLDVVAAHHPAFGHTVTYDSLRGLYVALDAEDDPAGWARAAGNRWTEVIGGAIRAADFERVNGWEPTIPDDAPVGYGAARSADGSQVAIAAAAEVRDPEHGDLVIVEILDVLPTAYKAADHVAGWATDGALAVDPSGPSAGLAADLAKRLGKRLMPVTSRDYSAACAGVVDALGPRAIRYRRHPALDAAVPVLAKRSLGDGGFVWSRSAATAPIAAMEAATLAVLALQRRPVSAGKPSVSWGNAA